MSIIKTISKERKQQNYIKKNLLAKYCHLKLINVWIGGSSNSSSSGLFERASINYLGFSDIVIGIFNR